MGFSTRGWYFQQSAVQVRMACQLPSRVGASADLGHSPDRSGQPVCLEGGTLSKHGTFPRQVRVSLSAGEWDSQQTWDFPKTGQGELVSWRVGLSANMGLSPDRSGWACQQEGGTLSKPRSTSAQWHGTAVHRWEWGNLSKLNFITTQWTRPFSQLLVG